ncbi:unnamed protein product [Adineta ricciae]|uniref:Uncharacterized protein n=1 Tax=Adineta ricciae TaxID=249248 RepID=A0A816E548_ADIRI|nr:unnamed protein product [Adineta ricciae]
MFAIIAALNTFSRKHDEHEALNYENYVCTGQAVPLTKVYRESSFDRRVRKELANIRRMERIQQQVKLVRLMKKLLLKIEGELSDEIVEQMRLKIAQIEIKVTKSARAEQINCDDMLDLDKPDDNYDIEIEEMIRKSIENNDPELITVDNYASGDHTQISKEKDLLN